MPGRRAGTPRTLSDPAPAAAGDSAKDPFGPTDRAVAVIAPVRDDTGRRRAAPEQTDVLYVRVAAYHLNVTTEGVGQSTAGSAGGR
ncbi:hypothetical protein GCM10022384_39980 [Streptomyces marokkonensis]|uniref:Uncharacterized protein n=1 Tax=Streptomyces marokkonensis TaxID=324855 RepID=A0ABP7QTZ9_9ACTN